jgi:hypothetical protein
MNPLNAIENTPDMIKILIADDQTDQGNLTHILNRDSVLKLSDPAQF